MKNNTASFPSLWPEGFFNPLNAGSSLSAVLSSLVGLTFIVGGLYVLYLLIRGGFDIMSSGGDQQKLQDGRSRITYALLGLVVLLASWGLIMLVEQMFGFCLGFTCPISLNEIGPGI